MAGTLSFERLFDAAPAAILVSDESRRVVHANAEASRLLGYRPGELVGRNTEVIVPEELREEYAQGREQYLADGEQNAIGSSFEARLLLSDGSELPVEASASIVETEAGKLIVTVLRDLSAELEGERERRELETTLKRATGGGSIDAQLEQTGRLETVGQLAGGIAHDFNNILGVIINYSQFVIDELEEGSHTRADVEEIWRAARRGAALTRQLTVFSRHEPRSQGSVNLNDVVSELEVLLKRTLGEHIELNTGLGAKLWPIEADHGQLEQALVNLALNSRDAMPEGGTLTLKTENVELDESEAGLYSGIDPGNFVRLSVEDTGLGMDGEAATRAFEPFYTTKAQGEGTGLGLAMVYGIVTSAGGAVALSSEPGVGTVISAHFPASGVGATSGEGEPDRRQVPVTETVLVVEDDPSLRRMAERILHREGYEVIASPGGRDALRKLEGDDHVDLLLTDVVMPEMSGTELAGRGGALPGATDPLDVGIRRPARGRPGQGGRRPPREAVSSRGPAREDPRRARATG